MSSSFCLAPLFLYLCTCLVRQLLASLPAAKQLTSTIEVWTSRLSGSFPADKGAKPVTGHVWNELGSTRTRNLLVGTAPTTTVVAALEVFFSEP